MPGVMWLLEGGNHGNYTENRQCISPVSRETLLMVCALPGSVRTGNVLESVARTLQSTCAVQSSTSLFPGGDRFSSPYFE